MSVTRDICTVLAAKLIADAGVSALVGSRVRPIVLDQRDTVPAIVYSLVNQEGWHSLQGGTTCARSRVQFFAYGNTITEAINVSDAIMASLDGYRGQTQDIFVSSCMLDNSYDMADPPTKGSAEWRYRRAIDFVVCHEV